jgi:hypothetical protein
MKPGRYFALLGAALVSAALLSCSTQPTPTPAVPAESGSAGISANLAADYAALSKAGGRVYAIDPPASDIRIASFEF